MALSFSRALCALVLASCATADPVPPVPVIPGDQDYDGVADVDDACPTEAGTDHGCPAPVEPTPSEPGMTSAEARVELDRILARTNTFYPWFTADRGPRGVVPAIDALRVADPATKARAKALVEEAQAAYDALDRANADKAAVDRDISAERVVDPDTQPHGWFGVAPVYSDLPDRFVKAHEAVAAARAATDAADQRLVAALREMIASNEATR